MNSTPFWKICWPKARKIAKNQPIREKHAGLRKQRRIFLRVHALGARAATGSGLDLGIRMENFGPLIPFQAGPLSMDSSGFRFGRAATATASALPALCTVCSLHNIPPWILAAGSCLQNTSSLKYSRAVSSKQYCHCLHCLISV